jgi:AraC-like DNA-binding protein
MLKENGKRFYMKLQSNDVICESGVTLNQNTELENQLIYVAKGSCTIQNSNKATRIMTCGLVYLRRYVQYTLHTEQGAPVLVYRLHFIRSSDPQYLDLDNLGTICPFIMEFMAFRSRVCFLIDYEGIYVTINEIISEISAGFKEKNLMLNALMTALYIKMARSYQAHGKSCGIIYVTEAKKYISEHYAEKLSIQKIADHLGISRSYLEIIFSKYVGHTITAHINAVRTEKAAYLLTTTSLGIVDAALSAGYENRQHFAREFKSRFQLSPSQYRKLHGKRKIDADEYYNRKANYGNLKNI